MGGIDLHDVPQDRIAADLDHRLRAQHAFLGDAGAVAARQDHRLHGCPSRMKYSASTSRLAATTRGPSAPGSTTLFAPISRSITAVLADTEKRSPMTLAPTTTALGNRITPLPRVGSFRPSVPPSRP